MLRKQHLDNQFYVREGVWSDCALTLSESEPVFMTQGAYNAREHILRHEQLSAAGLVNSRIFQQRKSRASRLHQRTALFTATVTQYSKDTKVSCKPTQSLSKPHKGGVRGKVRGLSRASRRNAIHKLVNSGLNWVAFATLTIPPVELATNAEWIKTCLNRWLTKLRRYKPSVAYFWVLERQKNGSLHLHVLLDRYMDKKWLSRSWWDSCGRLSDAHLRAGTSVESVRDRNKLTSYLLSTYLTKQTQKDFEDWTGRVWGCSRSVKAVAESVTKIVGTHANITRVIRHLLKAHQNRRKGWSWHGFSFTAYRCASITTECLSWGFARVEHIPHGDAWVLTAPCS